MTTSTLKIESGTQPIPGYTIIKKLGAGGYGEVWSVEAPGGMEKAIKFVYGSHDSQRSMRELRSLNRIKGVHHPFLLSLERFEVVNDQLLIVTELASGSLEDIFNTHRERGNCGIPKNELLKYLHDAADGLDYLHSEFQLQHLDVKPGNLLIVGGHVKVGDFGLLKELGDVDCSMVGGLTPVYAAPEVFDGRPHQHSDQYSLAIMYQELLTGHRPFLGRTIAQLATQHIHSAPNLDSLPPMDRPVIARALEKDPSRRFSSCHELVDRLKRSTQEPVRIPGAAESISSNTASLEDLNEIVAASPQAVVQRLPGVESNELPPTKTSQAFVIALGGIGRAVLERLCTTQTQNSELQCDLRGLLIDTDDAELYRFREFEISNNLICNVQRACFPLKSAHSYRESGAERYSTISRRWIYNVPKSCKTEGLRPLGRLALIDHASHLKRMIVEAISGLQVDRDACLMPRVYVVGSLFGGTASGMFLDVAFLTRHLLDESDMADVHVRPIVLASVPEDLNHSNPLSVASTYAALSEVSYFLQPNKGYPGDSDNDLPSVPAARTPMSAAYVAAPIDGQDGVQLLTDYVWTDAFIAPAVMDQARKPTDQQELNRTQATIRSFGAAELNVRPSINLDRLLHRSLDQLIRQWMGNPQDSNEDIQPIVDELLSGLSVSPQHWADQQLSDLIGQTADQWKSDLEEKIRADLPAKTDDSFLATKESVISARAIAQPILAQAAESNIDTEEQPATNQRVVDLADQCIAALQQTLQDRLVNSDWNLFKTVEILRALRKQLYSFALHSRSHVDQLRKDSANTLQRLMNDLSTVSVADVPMSEISTALLEQIQADLQAENGNQFQRIGDQIKRFEQKLLGHAKHLAAVHQLVVKAAPKSKPLLNSTERKLLPRAVEQLNQDFAGTLLCASLPNAGAAQTHAAQPLATPTRSDAIASQRDPSNDTASTISTDTKQSVSGNRSETNTESRVTESATEERPVFRNTTPIHLKDPAETLAELKHALQTISDNLLDDTSGAGIITPQELEAHIRGAIQNAHPTLLRFGGSQRIMIVGEDKRQLLALKPLVERETNSEVTVIAAPGANTMILQEASEIPVQSILANLIGHLKADLTIAGRLMSRCDLQWDNSIEKPPTDTTSVYGS